MKEVQAAVEENLNKMAPLFYGNPHCHAQRENLTTQSKNITEINWKYPLVWSVLYRVILWQKTLQTGIAITVISYNLIW